MHVAMVIWVSAPPLPLSSPPLSRVRGWWVRGQRGGRVPQTSGGLQMTDRRSARSPRRGGSSRHTQPRETRQHRSEWHTHQSSSALNMRPSAGSHSLVPPPSLSGAAPARFYIHVRHVGWTHPSSDGAQRLADRGWSRAVTDVGLTERPANRGVSLSRGQSEEMQQI